MNHDAFVQNHSAWSSFTEMLNHEFLKQTGRGMYAYITPIMISNVYAQYQNENKSLHDFVQHYVRIYS